MLQDQRLQERSSIPQNPVGIPRSPRGAWHQGRGNAGRTRPAVVITVQARLLLFGTQRSPTLPTGLYEGSRECGSL